MTMTITSSRGARTAFSAMTMTFIGVIAICAICDYATARAFTWVGFPVASLIFTWAVVSPILLAERRKVVAGLAGLTVALYPFLWYLGRLAPYENWPFRLGLPLAAVGLGAVWLTYLLVRYAPVNKLLIAAALTALYGIGVNIGVNFFVSRFLGFPVMLQFSDMIVLLTSGSAALGLGLAGVCHEIFSRF